VAISFSIGVGVPAGHSHKPKCTGFLEFVGELVPVEGALDDPSYARGRRSSSSAEQGHAPENTRLHLDEPSCDKIPSGSAVHERVQSEMRRAMLVDRVRSKPQKGRRKQQIASVE
jgi:hypothetical protein